MVYGPLMMVSSVPFNARLMPASGERAFREEISDNFNKIKALWLHSLVCATMVGEPGLREF
jgi:hypothetical protein